MTIPRKHLLLENSSSDDGFVGSFSTISQDTTYTAKSNGFLIIYGGQGNGNTTIKIKLNGTEHSFGMSGGRYQYGWVNVSFTFPIRKGVKFSYNCSGTAAIFTGSI